MNVIISTEDGSIKMEKAQKALNALIYILSNNIGNAQQMIA